MRILIVCLVLVCLLLAAFTYWYNLPANNENIGKGKFTNVGTEFWLTQPGASVPPADALHPANEEYIE